jgi:ketosteroid isomerase-like protein
MGATGALAAVHGYIDAFNRGDQTAMASFFDSDGVILDGMPPHVWQGPSALQTWYRDVMAESAHIGAKDYVVTIGAPSHNDVTGDHAYLALPATMRFALNGRQVTQTDAHFTVALRRLDDEWRITAWAWTKGTRQP